MHSSAESPCVGRFRRKQRLAGIPPCFIPRASNRMNRLRGRVMTVHRGKSNGHVVRLETFFAEGAVAAGGPDGSVPQRTRKTAVVVAFPPVRQAAARAGAGAVAAAASNRTDTRFDTPDSSIVTP